MKSFSAVIVSAAFASAGATETNPVAKVLDLISSLQAKIIGEGTEAQKAYDEYAEWCEDSSKNLDYEIKTGKQEVADLKALIAEQVATIDELTAKVEDLASSISTDEADLQAATEIRNKEAKDFGAEEGELVEVVDTLSRAVGILEREMAKGGASLLQNVNGVVQALTVMVQASALSSADASKLTALVQQGQESDDDSMGSPAAAVYEGHSGGILDVLGNLQEEAEGQLDAARKKETNALHNFEMLKQSLTDQIKFSTGDSDAARKGMAQASEKKAGAEGDLDVTSKDLAEDLKGLGGLHQDCMTKAQDFEASTKSRAEELSALASAKKVIAETTGGAASQSYGLNQVSFLQISAGSKLSSKADLARFEAVRVVRDLAMKVNSPALAQLASRMSNAMRVSSGSADPFAKVKGLIEDMLTKLESDADADATQKAYCDKEMAESHEKKDDMNTEIEKLTTKIDQMSARSAKLKEEVATLQKELATLAKEQQDMNKFRSEEKAIYDHDRPELEQGLDGIKTALKVLREYYAQDKSHESADGAAGGIVGLLEVVESDFSKGLAEMIATEESSAATYDRETKENAVEKATKDKDETYKTKEYVGLDKAIAQASSDRTGVNTELSAVMDYLTKLDDICIAKPDTYAERKSRREAELAGLKEALTILEGQALLQQSSKRTLREIVKASQDPCAGCTNDHAQAYQTCAMIHGDPCAELNSKGLVGSGPGKKRDVSCCMKKEKHNRCMSCKSMDCAHGTCNVNKKYYSQYSDTEAENKRDKNWHNKAMKAAGWAL